MCAGLYGHPVLSELTRDTEPSRPGKTRIWVGEIKMKRDETRLGVTRPKRDTRLYISCFSLYQGC